MSRLPANWLVRALDERDYGIDLSIELFQGEHPTGCFALVQVKGTTTGFDEPLSLSDFPTKTLEYAQLFPQPFFIFHTSVKDRQTKFVWAQKYIDTRLSVDRRDWTSQDSTTIHFPSDNVLGTKDGNAKIERIMRLLAAQKSGLDFLADYEWLRIHWEYYKLGEPAALDKCVSCTQRIALHKRFLDVYLHAFMGLDFGALHRYLTALPDPAPYEGDGYSPQFAQELSRGDMLLAGLDALKMSFLNQGELDAFEEEYSSSSPY